MGGNMQNRINKLENNLNPTGKRIEDIIREIDLEKRFDTLSSEEHAKLVELKNRPVEPVLEKTLRALAEKHSTTCN